VQYRTFGKLEWPISALGFGCARFPIMEGEYAQVDEEEAIRMLRAAIEGGVNYVDTAYNYHGGNSERVVGKALQGGYRDKVKLATKLPCWLVDTVQDCDRLLDEQLGRLQCKAVDLYLLHGLNGHPNGWHKMRDLGVIEWAEGVKADGRIGHLGFSFHDRYSVFREIVNAYDGWAMCQVQYNYMDVETQAGIRGVQYAAAKGLAVVVMEPLLGGRLANLPSAVEEVWKSAAVKRMPVDWALQWLWNQPEVSVVLSGMSTMEQVEQNLASAGTSGVHTLSDEELAVIERARKVYQSFRGIPCTQCRYCMPCTQGVDIPFNFYLYNFGLMYDRASYPRGFYRDSLAAEARADACVQCRECERRCTQQILISEWMPVVHAVLGEDRPYPE
jgi:predicted aldo/keto reductase-like oxidoreductase